MPGRLLRRDPVILLVDNRDSFTWNVVHLLAAEGAEVEVVANDAAPAAELLARRPQAVVLGPGPGRPEEAGVVPELLAALPDDLPLLGVCLGHQGLVQHHGGRWERDPEPVHGRASPVHHAGRGLFEGLPSPMRVGRYHSLRMRRDALPPELVLTAWTGDGEVMAVEHARLPRFGVQFHPDSILTPEGPALARRFLRIVERASAEWRRSAPA